MPVKRMKKCIFDTNAVSLMFSENLPEIWDMYFKQVRKGERILLLFEPLISEIFYKNEPNFGISVCKDKIYQLKALPRVEIHRLNDNDAINAGEIKVRYSKYDLSLVDCYLLSIGKSRKCMIITTDHNVRDVGKKIDVEIKYHPLAETEIFRR